MIRGFVARRRAAYERYCVALAWEWVAPSRPVDAPSYAPVGRVLLSPRLSSR